MLIFLCSDTTKCFTWAVSHILPEFLYIFSDNPNFCLWKLEFLYKCNDSLYLLNDSLCSCSDRLSSWIGAETAYTNLFSLVAKAPIVMSHFGLPVSICTKAVAARVDRHGFAPQPVRFLHLWIQGIFFLWSTNIIRPVHDVFIHTGQPLPIPQHY